MLNIKHLNYERLDIAKSTLRNICHYSIALIMDIGKSNTLIEVKHWCIQYQHMGLRMIDRIESNTYLTKSHLDIYDSVHYHKNNKINDMYFEKISKLMIKAFVNFQIFLLGVNFGSKSHQISKKKIE